MAITPVKPLPRVKPRKMEGTLKTDKPRAMKKPRDMKKPLPTKGNIIDKKKK